MMKRFDWSNLLKSSKVCSRQKPLMNKIGKIINSILKGSNYKSLRSNLPCNYVSQPKIGERCLVKNVIEISSFLCVGMNIYGFNIQ